MEGYDYEKNTEDLQNNRVTKAPVIKQDLDQMGITQRAVHDLFKEIRRVKENDGKHINVFCSFLQIYNERVFDLLNHNSLKNQKNADPMK